MNIQLFGADLPPWYHEVETIEKIAKIDEKINALFIERAYYVEELKKSKNK